MAAQPATVSLAQGLGADRAAVLLAGLELGRRAIEEAGAEADKFTTPAEVFAYLHPSMRDLPHESFRVLLLDPACRLRREVAIELHRVATGGAVNLRDVFRAAVIDGAHGLVLVQNRPCGDPSPSPGGDYTVVHGGLHTSRPRGPRPHHHRRRALLLSLERGHNPGMAARRARRCGSRHRGKPAPECPWAVR
jgi:hypothetical protein